VKRVEGGVRLGKGAASKGVLVSQGGAGQWKGNRNNVSRGRGRNNARGSNHLVCKFKKKGPAPGQWIRGQ